MTFLQLYRHVVKNSGGATGSAGATALRKPAAGTGVIGTADGHGVAVIGSTPRPDVAILPIPNRPMLPIPDRSIVPTPEVPMLPMPGVPILPIPDNIPTLPPSPDTSPAGDLTMPGWAGDLRSGVGTMITRLGAL